MHRACFKFTRCRLPVAALAACLALLAVPPARAQDAGALQARHAAMADALARSPFQRPLVLESVESDGGVRGDIYARVDQPFATLAPALQGVDHWCEILLLHLNVKQCRAGPVGSTAALQLVIGSKFDQPVAQAYRFAFSYQVPSNGSDHLQVLLQADEGPLGTSAYRIALEAVALDSRRSFLHLAYAYRHGASARLAMQAYLATIGRGKVGFSVVGRQADGSPIHVGSLRGVIERNTMRYYLAIEAYLGALGLPPSQQLARRLNDWHSGVERYPLQLHELERGEYLDLKRIEMQRHAAAGG